MCDIETLRLFINQRLSAVAEDILSVFVRTLVDYQRQLDVLNPPAAAVKTQPADFFPACEEAVSPERHERHDREDPPYGSTLALLPVKREDGDESMEAEEPAAGTSTQHTTATQDEHRGTSDHSGTSSQADHRGTATQADHRGTATQADHRGTATQADHRGTSAQPADDDDDVQVLSSLSCESDGELTEDSDEWGETGGGGGGRSALKTLKSRKTLDAEAGRSMSLRNEPSHDPESSKEISPAGHAGEQSFNFTFSGKGFNDSLHLQSQSPLGIETGENCFSCTFCGRGFSQMSNLKKHTMTHTGEKPFWCSVCGKGFNQKVNLKTHFRVHTGEKPFSCTVCGKSFNQHGTVKMHMRVHTGEKPYACSICGKSFSQRGVLKSHMAIHIAQLNS